MTKRLKTYRRTLIYITAALLVVTIGVVYQYLRDQIPDRITLQVDQEHELDWIAPVTLRMEPSIPTETATVMLDHKEVRSNEIHMTTNNVLSLEAQEIGNFEMEVRLFGILPCKTIEVDMVDAVRLIPCGFPIGIYARTDGLLVLGTGVIRGKDGLNYEPAAGVVRTGDYIYAVNGIEVMDIDSLTKLVNSQSGNDVKLTVRRDEQRKLVSVKKATAQDGSKKLGIWLREDTQGIGTLTYATSDGRFGALGHGITDSEAGVLVAMNGGSIYPAKVLDIMKGKKGKPGELAGSIQMTEKQVLGDLTKNTRFGIFGLLRPNHPLLSGQASYPVGYRHDIEKGSATILCSLGEHREEYKIRIDKINLRSRDNKGMVLRITDSRLLEKTGGIIQGMSGSPILQNGRIIGAITHVFVNDPTKGYGIFAETMLEQE